MAGRGGDAGAEAARGLGQLPPGSPAVSAEVVLLQLHGDPRPHLAQRRQFRLLPPDPPPVRRVHVLPGGAPGGRSHGGNAHRRDGRVQRPRLPVSSCARERRLRHPRARNRSPGEAPGEARAQRPRPVLAGDLG